MFGTAAMGLGRFVFLTANIGVFWVFGLTHGFVGVQDSVFRFRVWDFGSRVGCLGQLEAVTAAGCCGVMDLCRRAIRGVM